MYNDQAFITNVVVDDDDDDDVMLLRGYMP